jgi:MoaA/NifB/PqqE/SkfB family radical SAM enzyme
MRFPLRLTADLALDLAARSLQWKRDRSLISILSANGDPIIPISPIVWISGSEPLDLPETPRLVNSLAAAGRHVFLPTSGILLRRRIHEFQPSPRLHLTIRFDGDELSHDARAGRQGAFGDALESVRTARLSGFLLCAQLILHSPGQAAELAQLLTDLRKLDFDGFLISPSAASGQELQQRTARLRRQLLTRRWRLLSTLLDSVISAPVETEAAHHSSPRRSRAVATPVPKGRREESVQAP